MTNLTIQTTAKALATICFNFSIEMEKQAYKAYVDFIFNQLSSENLTNDDFNKACNAIIKTETNLYGKMPTVAMFLKYADKQQLTLEQQAKIEADTIINHLSQFYYTDDVRDCVFDKPQTNTAVNKIGGLLYIFRRLKLGDEKTRPFLKKDLAETWLNYYHSSHQDSICKGSTDFYFGIGAGGETRFRYREAEIHYVGDKSEVKKIEQSKPTKNQERVNLLISKIGRK